MRNKITQVKSNTITIFTVWLLWIPYKIPKTWHLHRHRYKYRNGPKKQKAGRCIFGLRNRFQIGLRIGITLYKCSENRFHYVPFSTMCLAVLCINTTFCAPPCTTHDCHHLLGLKTWFLTHEYVPFWTHLTLTLNSDVLASYTSSKRSKTGKIPPKSVITPKSVVNMSEYVS